MNPEVQIDFSISKVADAEMCTTIPQEKAQIGFSCQFCGKFQSLGDSIPTYSFPVCYQCKKDIGEMIKEKRSTK